ncbi:MAG: iron-containing alcohol dehydrogenase [Clostridium perfringens]|nr:iron-containing alcohol dehydrogenase [Clostridium perfringens]
MKRFTIPRDLYFEKGSIEELRNLVGNRAVIVTGGGSMKKFGFLDKVIAYLEEAKMTVKLIEGVEPDPSVDTVLAGADIMKSFKPDWIVAVGGGSPIDAAKAMWIFYEHPDLVFDDIKDPFTIPKLRNKAKFVAIPSTSGTGTEVTAFSVITDHKTGNKYLLADYNITPDIAIVDPDLAQTMPKKLTAHTGMDALTHGIEAYVATPHSVFTDPLAIEAIDIVKNNLFDSYNGDKKAREIMHYGQCLAGMAFSNALLGITHSMAHKSGAVFGIPHGCANAIYLPYVINFNKKSAASRYGAIARKIGLTGTSDDELTNSLVDMIKEMNRKMQIPLTLKEYGIDETEFNNKVRLISERAVLDACTSANPRSANVDEIEKIFVAAYYGKDIDF